MKRIILAIGSISVSQILPLLFHPELIIEKRNIIVMIAHAAIWLTQPAVSASETKRNKSRDKFSVLLILFFSIGSIAVSTIDWAYFHKSVSQVFLIAGILFMTIGVIFRFWAINVLGELFTPTVQIKANHTLIVKGPYSIVRHPSYLGAWATITGATIFFNSPVGFVFSMIGMGVSYYFRIKVEEKALIEVFGQKYLNYQKNVKRIIPFLW